MYRRPSRRDAYNTMQASHRYYPFQLAVEVGEVSHLTMSSCCVWSVHVDVWQQTQTPQCVVILVGVDTTALTTTRYVASTSDVLRG